MRKLFFVTSILILSIFSVFIYQKIKFEDGKTHIIFCNVGQGDGILIRTPSGLDIVNDGGPDDSILGCLSRHMPFWDRKIELVFLSHPHSDHITGLVSILNSYQVSSFATENLSNTTAIYKKLINVLKDKNLKIQYVYAGDSFQTPDGLSIRIIGPSKEFLEKANPNGIVGESSESGSLSTLFTIENFNVIITGDAPIGEMEEAIGNSLPKINVFQIPHHGSRYNSNEELIAEISPELTVVSVGKNTYGHPAAEVLKILEDLKIPYLRTDRHGDVEIISDGKSFTIN